MANTGTVEQEARGAESPKRNRILALVALPAACAAYLALSFLTYDQVDEDTFIYLRVAQNLAAGHGYVFNPGDAPLETGSSLPWQLLLVGLVWLPMPLVSATKLLGIAFGLGTLVLVYRLSQRTLAHAASWPVAPLLLAFAVPYVMWCQRGLETSFYVFVLVWTTLWLLDPGRGRRWILPAGLLLVSRPEGPAVVAVLLLFGWLAGRPRRSAWVPSVVLGGVLLATLALRLAYFHDLVPQPFYMKAGLRTSRAMGSLHAFLGEARIYLLLLPFLGVAWRRSFWRFPTALLTLLSALLLAWAATNLESRHFFRHAVPALPFLFLLCVRAMEVLADRLPRGRLPAAFAGYLLMVGAVASDPTVPLLLRQSGPNPLHEAARLFLEQPGPYLGATLQKLRDPSSLTMLDERGPTQAWAIDHNWQALVGKFVALNYGKGAILVYDQMGQTPWYAGDDKIFIDSLGLTDRVVGLHHFAGRAEREPLLGGYHALASTLLGWLFPQEQRTFTSEEALEHVFASRPQVVMLTIFALNNPRRLPPRLQSSKVLSSGYRPAFKLLDGAVLVYERRDLPHRLELQAPAGLDVAPWEEHDPT